MEKILNNNNLMCWCICIKNNDNRYKHVCSEFKKIGILEDVNFHRPERSKEGGEIGCWNSHIYCMRQCLRNNKHALIFEDDVFFSTDFKKYINNIENMFKIPNWEILRLGGLVWHYLYPSDIDYNIWAVQSNAAHAIIINNKLLVRLLQFSTDFDPYTYKTFGSGIDDYYKNNNFNDFIINKNICFQKPFDDEIQNCWYKIQLFQRIITHNTIFIPVQKMINNIAWYLRCFPLSIQKCLNPFLLITYFHIYIDKII